MTTAPFPTLGVSLGLWQDRPSHEVLVTALAADRLDFSDLWIGEMATYDAFALGALVAERTRHIPLTIGPFAVAVRDPVMIAMGVATVAELTGRRVNVAIGSSSPLVVEQWHGRVQRRPAIALAEMATALRVLLAGEKLNLEGEVLRSQGYRLRATAPNCELTIAAFGAGAINVAATMSDRMVVNLVTPHLAGRLASAMRDDAARAGCAAPRVAAWVTAAIDPSTESFEQLRRGIVGYLGAPGYGEMFSEAGFGDVVTFARQGPHPRDLLAAIPDDLVRSVSLIGDLEEVRAGLLSYADAGVDEVIVVPSSVESDPGGVHTLESLATLAGPVRREAR
ncbi:MAG: LLM class F420-dependent oxidoreductase [Acidimicrobiales bacterium]